MLNYVKLVFKMKKKAISCFKKAAERFDYHEEIIVKPAERLLKALLEAEEKEITKKKVRRTAISR